MLVLMRMRPRHALGDGVGGERGQATAAVMARAVVVMARSVVAQVVVALDLRGSGGQQIDIHARGGPLAVARVRTQIGAHVVGIVGEGVRRRNIRRADLGDRRRASDGLAGRGHDVGGVGHGSVLTSGGGGSGSSSQVLGLVAAARVGVVVDSRVARELVRTAEALRAAGELASVRLLARVRPNVTSLVLETVEGTVAERTFVGPGEVLADLLVGRTSTLHERRQ